MSSERCPNSQWSAEAQGKGHRLKSGNDVGDPWYFRKFRLQSLLICKLEGPKLRHSGA